MTPLRGGTQRNPDRRTDGPIVAKFARCLARLFCHGNGW